MSTEMWNARYSESEYAYGTEPNDFLRAEAGRIPRGPVVCLAEGEGRNAVYLAGLGHDVTAVDFSREGLRKAGSLAAARGVALTLVEADLTTFPLAPDSVTGIVAIFAHVPRPVRARLLGEAVRALRPGGCLVLESYTPAQIALGTGGPKDPSLLPTLEDLRTELAGLSLDVAREVEREIHEGRFHGGRSATVQVVATRLA